MTPVKPFLPIADQISRLEARGMIIEDHSEAAQWLAAVGYYRLSGYRHPFRVPDADPRYRRDRFTDGSTFKEVIALYEFDRHLKNLMHSGLERVEVAMRSQIGYTLGAHDPLAHINPTLFRPRFRHTQWMDTANRRIDRARGRDAFVDHHDHKYDGILPVWVLTDVLDFADVSRLFGGMLTKDQRAVSEWFALTVKPEAGRNQRKKWVQNPPLANWLLHLTIVRNICAHHGRLWNRQLTPVGTPAVAHLHGFEGLPSTQTEHVYGTICMIAFLLDATSPGNTWIRKVESLVSISFAHFAHRTAAEMGFPTNWRELPLWAP